MNETLKNEILSQMKKLEEALFNAHRNEQDQRDMNLLGLAWKQQEEARKTYEKTVHLRHAE